MMLESASKPRELGNVWLTAAAIAMSYVQSGEVLAMSLRDDGSLEGVPPSHPEFQNRVLAAGYVCTLTAGSDASRIAAKVRQAALRVAAKAAR